MGCKARLEGTPLVLEWYKTANTREYLLFDSIPQFDLLCISYLTSSDLCLSLGRRKLRHECFCNKPKVLGTDNLICVL